MLIRAFALISERINWRIDQTVNAKNFGQLVSISSTIFARFSAKTYQILAPKMSFRTKNARKKRW
jgi:hypothetical protein